jgi:hypothetical protein
MVMVQDLHGRKDTSKRPYGSRPEEVLDRRPAGLHTDIDRPWDLQADAAGRTLKIDVTRADVGVSEVLRASVVRRVLLALSRFGPRVRKVSVRLAEPANPLGGVDQRCRMHAWMRQTDDIHAEAINGGFESAVTRAAAQLAKRMDFALDGGVSHEAGATPGLPGRLALGPRRARARGGRANGA